MTYSEKRFGVAWLALFGALMIVSAMSSSAVAGYSVKAGSVTVVPGQTGVTIPIKIENDAPLIALVAPLIIRQIGGGAYVTSFRSQFSERVRSVITSNTEIVNIRQVDGACGADGLGTIMFSDQESHPVSSPVGALMVWYRSDGASLPAGTDISGSMLLTVDIDLPVGVFEIDVTCTDPSNILKFIDDEYNPIIPTFQVGTITVIPNCCDTPGDANNNGTSNIADAIYIISMVFDSGPTPSCCNEGDANGNSAVNIADAIYIINAVFNSGPSPICGMTGSGC